MWLWNFFTQTQKIWENRHVVKFFCLDDGQQFSVHRAVFVFEKQNKKMCGTSGNHGPEISHDFLLRQCLFWIFCLYIKTAAETVTIVAMQCIYHCFLFHSLHCVFLFVRYVCGWHKNGVFVIKKCSIRLGTELDKSWENIKTEEEVNFQSSTVLIYSTKYKRRHPTSW